MPPKAGRAVAAARPPASPVAKRAPNKGSAPAPAVRNVKQTAPVRKTGTAATSAAAARAPVAAVEDAVADEDDEEAALRREIQELGGDESDWAMLREVADEDALVGAGTATANDQVPPRLPLGPRVP